MRLNNQIRAREIDKIMEADPKYIRNLLLTAWDAWADKIAAKHVSPDLLAMIKNPKLSKQLKKIRYVGGANGNAGVATYGDEAGPEYPTTPEERKEFNQISKEYVDFYRMFLALERDLTKAAVATKMQRDLEDVLDEVYAKYSVNFEKYVDFAERTIEKNKIV